MLIPFFEPIPELPAPKLTTLEGSRSVLLYSQQTGIVITSDGALQVVSLPTQTTRVWAMTSAPNVILTYSEPERSLYAVSLAPSTVSHEAPKVISRGITVLDCIDLPIHERRKKATDIVVLLGTTEGLATYTVVMGGTEESSQMLSSLLPHKMISCIIQRRKGVVWGLRQDLCLFCYSLSDRRMEVVDIVRFKAIYGHVDGEEILGIASDDTLMILSSHETLIPVFTMSKGLTVAATSADTFLLSWGTEPCHLQLMRVSGSLFETLIEVHSQDCYSAYAGIPKSMRNLIHGAECLLAFPDGRVDALVLTGSPNIVGESFMASKGHRKCQAQERVVVPVHAFEPAITILTRRDNSEYTVQIALPMRHRYTMVFMPQNAQIHACEKHSMTDLGNIVFSSDEVPMFTISPSRKGTAVFTGCTIRTLVCYEGDTIQPVILLSIEIPPFSLETSSQDLEAPVLTLTCPSHSDVPSALSRLALGAVVVAIPEQDQVTIKATHASMGLALAAELYNATPSPTLLENTTVIRSFSYKASFLRDALLMTVISLCELRTPYLIGLLHKELNIYQALTRCSPRELLSALASALACLETGFVDAASLARSYLDRIFVQSSLIE
ncbi:hypothetical protein GMRT_13233 [Giardia muris]|uniref:Uncharacterized protein n=1 Tax=Giardia muris TaxID=5742 RepID=A0A4Z1T6E9_GIAMU|nr:hypothetical protein GMRT_13233 [Giardia muris]|eukprot:TNJ28707.1 hypothetical protein GMRT_13233 [Giardia muris]